MSTVISFVNQKGGTGKTTACVNVAAGLANRDRRILLIDLDPQSNATLSLGIDLTKIKNSMYEVLLNHVNLSNIYYTVSESLTVCPAKIELTNTDISLEGHQTRLKEILENCQDTFDYILIDCPPALNLLTVNALVSSNEVIIPVLCDYLSMEGLKQLLQTIGRVRDNFNSSLHILGILPNMVDHRRNLTNEILGLIHKEFGDAVFRTEIPICVSLAESPSFGKDIFNYASWSTGAEFYGKLIQEIIRRIERG